MRETYKKAATRCPLNAEVCRHNPVKETYKNAATRCPLNAERYLLNNLRDSGITINGKTNCRSGRRSVSMSAAGSVVRYQRAAGSSVVAAINRVGLGHFHANRCASSTALMPDPSHLKMRCLTGLAGPTQRGRNTATHSPPSRRTLS